MTILDRLSQPQETIVNPVHFPEDVDARILEIPQHCLSCPGILGCITKAMEIQELPGPNTPTRDQVFHGLLDHVDMLVENCETGTIVTPTSRRFGSDTENHDCGSSVVTERQTQSPFPQS